MKIAVLALQGAFREHIQRLQQLGAEAFEVRSLQDWQQPKDGLILPGGESTVMRKLLRETGLYDPIKAELENGLPVFGTCAGLILLSEKIEGEADTCFGTMNIVAKRNAYGRQLGSFHTEAAMLGIEGEIPMTFIRAPYIAEAGNGVEVLATVDGKIVAARQGSQLATAFHPELDEDTRVHQYFLDMVKG